MIQIKLTGDLNKDRAIKRFETWGNVLESCFEAMEEAKTEGEYNFMFSRASRALAKREALLLRIYEPMMH